MIKFYDNDFLIYTDKKIFDEDKFRREWSATASVNNDTIELAFFYMGDVAPIKLTISKEDLPNRKPVNWLITNNARHWKGNPEENPYIEVREQDDFMAKILLMMDYTNAHMCPRIQLYRHDDTIVCRPHIYTYYAPEASAIATDDSFGSIVASYNPDLDSKGFSRKETLSKNLHPLNSIAYLEAQVDILSKMLFAIIDSDEKYKKLFSEKIPMSDEFRNAIELNSVTNIKDMKDCIAEITLHKNRIRGLQKEYYAAKKTSSIHK